MPSTSVHALRYPVLGDAPNVPLDLQRLADDVERELVEHDVSLTSQAGTVAAMGVWQDYAAEVRPAASSTAAPGSSIAFARYAVIGKTAYVIGEAGSGSGIVTGASVTLPPLITASRRYLSAGNLTFQGTGVSTAQAGVAFMTPDAARIVAVSYTSSGYLDAPAGVAIRWNLTY